MSDLTSMLRTSKLTKKVTNYHNMKQKDHSHWILEPCRVSYHQTTLYCRITDKSTLCLVACCVSHTTAPLHVNSM